MVLVSILGLVGINEFLFLAGVELKEFLRWVSANRPHLVRIENKFEALNTTK
jgi:hypothetical protein